MKPELQRRLAELEATPARVKEALLLAEGDEELVDVIGCVRSSISRMTDMRRQAENEILPDQDLRVLAGSEYMVEVTRKADRSYNTPALMKTFQANGITLGDLLDANVLTLSWRWTELVRYMDRNELDMRKVASEIPNMGDPDGPHVGQIWKDGYPKWTLIDH